MKTIMVTATDRRSCDSVLSALRSIRAIVNHNEEQNNIHTLAAISLVAIQRDFPDAMLCETSGAELIVGNGTVLMEFRHG